VAALIAGTFHAANDLHRWGNALLTDLENDIFGLQVHVPLQHLQGPVPRDGCDLSDAQAALYEPRGCFVSQIVEP
jgi:hypothetical protein